MTIAGQIDKAEAARAAGNEGMARVCARRAAGWAIKAFLGNEGISLDTNSVIVHFRHMLADSGTHPELSPILEHLLQPKIRPNMEEEAFFPLDVDLIAEARQLIGVLFPETLTGSTS